MERKPYPSDVSDEEWAFMAPCLTLMKEDVPQREHSLREDFNGWRGIVRTGAQWRMLPNDLPPWHTVYRQSQCWINYVGYKRKQGSEVHLAVDTLGSLLALQVTPVNEQERAHVKQLSEEVQEVTGNSVEVAFVNQGYTGGQPEEEAQTARIELIVVKLAQAKKGFVLLPRRWVVERSFVWATRFRLLIRSQIFISYI